MSLESLERSDGRDAPGSAAEDLELARAVLRGSPEARRRFAERMRCVPKILAAKQARLGMRLSREDIEDLTQDVLVALLRRLDSYQGVSSLEAFAYRFCQHVLANHVRTRARRAAKGGERTEEAADRVLGAGHEEVYRALERVSPRLATIVQLKHFEGLTFDAIAAKLSLSSSTVKTQYRQALARLRELLEPSRQESDR